MAELVSRKRDEGLCRTHGNSVVILLLKSQEVAMCGVKNASVLWTGHSEGSIDLPRDWKGESTTRATAIK